MTIYMHATTTLTSEQLFGARPGTRLQIHRERVMEDSRGRGR